MLPYSTCILTLVPETYILEKKTNNVYAHLLFCTVIWTLRNDLFNEPKQRVTKVESNQSRQFSTYPAIDFVNQSLSIFSIRVSMHLCSWGRNCVHSIIDRRTKTVITCTWKEQRKCSENYMYSTTYPYS